MQFPLPTSLYLLISWLYFPTEQYLPIADPILSVLWVLNCLGLGVSSAHMSYCLTYHKDNLRTAQIDNRRQDPTSGLPLKLFLSQLQAFLRVWNLFCPWAPAPKGVVQAPRNFDVSELSPRDLQACDPALPLPSALLNPAIH